MTKRQGFDPTPTFKVTLVCLVLVGVLLTTLAHAEHDGIDHIENKFMPLMTHGEFVDMINNFADGVLQSKLDEIIFLCDSKRTFGLQSQTGKIIIFSCDRIPSI